MSTSTFTEVPRVGVGVFVFSRTTPSKFLVGTRIGSLGPGTLALPGGHLEFGESFEDCARREVKEETDLGIVNVRFLTAVNSVLKVEEKHYVTVFMVGEMEGEGEPVLMEPEKCEGWFWVEWEEMRRWAVAELEGDGARTGDGGSVSARGPAKIKLFLPLLNLVRDRPNAIPMPRLQ